MLADDANPATLAPAELARLVKRCGPDELLRLLQGPHRTAVLDEVVRRMPDVFRPDRAGSTEAAVHWRVGDRPEGGHDVYELVIAGGSCAVSPEPRHRPRLVLTIGAVDFLRVVTGNVSPMMLFLRGRMKAEGDPGLVMRFPGMFDVPKA